MGNINDSFFDGYYKEIWRQMIPDLLTTKEVDFIIPYFNLQPASKVLDLMCGFGRHAIALARKGIPVTAVDNLHDYIDEIKEITEKEQLPLKAIESGALEFRSFEIFDLAICMGNSLNFFDAQDTLKLLTNISSYLKPGGHLFVNSWSLAEIVLEKFKESSSSKIGEMEFIVKSKFLKDPTRIETVSTVIAPDGKTETKTGIDYIFSVAELESMLRKAGFVLNEIYSIPGKKKFSTGEPRAYIDAEKK